MTLFAHERSFYVGSLGEANGRFGSVSLEAEAYENDIYEFSIDDTSTIDLFLYGLSADGDADIELYQDSNGDGEIDAGDELIEGNYDAFGASGSISTQGEAGTYFARVYLYSGDENGYLDYSLDLSASVDSDSGETGTLFPYQHDYDYGVAGDELLASSYAEGDDAINVQGEVGTYFARVGLYHAGEDNYLNYELELSATATYPGEEQAPNLLPTEFKVGYLDGDRTEYGWLDDYNTADSFAFSVGEDEGVDVYLNELSSDADIRLIQDANNNDIVDSSEIIASSTLGSTESESILGIENPGDYLLQVYQHSGETSYELSFEVYALA